MRQAFEPAPSTATTYIQKEKTMKLQSYTFLLLCLLIGGLQPAFAQLSEGFEGSFPPPGWTVLDNGAGLTNEWEKSALNPNSGIAHAYVRFSNSTSALAEDWLVTPKLFPDVGDNTLTFYATDDFATNYGSSYTVRVSTTSPSDLGSFTTIATYQETDFTNDVYQQFSVDLSDYDEQEIYVAFVLQNTKGDSFFLDDVEGPEEALITMSPNCDANLISPTSGGTDVEIDATLKWSPASGDPSSYKLQIGTTPNGDEFLELTDVGASRSYKPTSDFRLGTTYYVNIIPYNVAGDAFRGDCTEFEFTTADDPNILLDCAGTGTPVNKTLCYGPSSSNGFAISSNNSDQVRILFNSGTVEAGQDELYIYDGPDDSGILLNPTKLYGNAGDLTGLSYVSSTGSLFIKITSDGSNDCESSNQTLIDYTASCVACAPPVGTAVAGTCDANNGQFFIDVNISDLGDGTVLISNDQDGTTQTVTTTGITSVGPFNFGTVTLTLENTTDAICNAELPSVTVNGCAPANDDCVNAIALTFSADTDCTNAESGTLAFSTVSDLSSNCSPGSRDVWYSFTPSTSEPYLFNLINVNGSAYIAIYEGDCISGLQLLTDDCLNEQRVSVSLVQNETYLVQVFTTDDFAPSFDLCVQPLPATPVNDLCANATVISCPGNVTLATQDATFATATDVAGCNGDPIGPGLWYIIAGTGDFVSIIADPTDWDVALQVWSGADCQSLSCIAEINDGTTGATERLSNLATTPGTNYYIYVGGFNAFELGGVFNLTVSCSGLPEATVTCLDDPLNDPCNEVLVEDGSIQGTVEACVDLLTSGEVVVQSGTTASFTAGTSITLTAGFHAEAGSTFSATIEDCTQASNIQTVEELPVQEGNLDFVSKDLLFKVAPNPVLDEATVNLYAPVDGPVEMVLTDVSGKTLRTLQRDVTAGWNEFTLQREELGNGLYFLSALTESGRVTIEIVLAK